MRARPRPHVLGIDDGPVDKRSRAPVPVVGVMMEGADLVEAVAITHFPVDGAGATDFLALWVSGLRLRPALQAVVVGGITIAGLGIVEIERLSRAAPPAGARRQSPCPRERPSSARARAGWARRAAGGRRTRRQQHTPWDRGSLSPPSGWDRRMLCRSCERYAGNPSCPRRYASRISWHAPSRRANRAAGPENDPRRLGSCARPQLENPVFRHAFAAPTRGRYPNASSGFFPWAKRRDSHRA